MAPLEQVNYAWASEWHIFVDGLQDILDPGSKTHAGVLQLAASLRSSLEAYYRGMQTSWEIIELADDAVRKSVWFDAPIIPPKGIHHRCEAPHVQAYLDGLATALKATLRMYRFVNQCYTYASARLSHVPGIIHGLRAFCNLEWMLGDSIVDLIYSTTQLRNDILPDGGVVFMIQPTPSGPRNLNITIPAWAGASTDDHDSIPPHHCDSLQPSA